MLPKMPGVAPSVLDRPMSMPLLLGAMSIILAQNPECEHVAKEMAVLSTTTVSLSRCVIAVQPTCHQHIPQRHAVGNNKEQQQCRGQQRGQRLTSITSQYNVTATYKYSAHLRPFAPSSNRQPPRHNEPVQHVRPAVANAQHQHIRDDGVVADLICMRTMTKRSCNA